MRVTIHPTFLSFLVPLAWEGRWGRNTAALAVVRSGLGDVTCCLAGVCSFEEEEVVVVLLLLLL